MPLNEPRSATVFRAATMNGNANYVLHITVIKGRVYTRAESVYTLNQRVSGGRICTHAARRFLSLSPSRVIYLFIYQRLLQTALRRQGCCASTCGRVQITSDVPAIYPARSPMLSGRVCPPPHRRKLSDYYSVFTAAPEVATNVISVLSAATRRIRTRTHVRAHTSRRARCT